MAIVGVVFFLLGILTVFVNTYSLVTLISDDSQKYIPTEMKEQTNKATEKEEPYTATILVVASICGAFAALFGFDFFRMKEYARKGLIVVSLVLLAYFTYIGINVLSSFSQYGGSDASSTKLIGYLALAGNFFLLFLLIRFLFRVNFKETA